MKKIPTFLKILSILIIAAFLVGLDLSCGGEEEPKQEEEQPEQQEEPKEEEQKNDLTDVDPSGLKSGINSNYELSKEKVKSWKENAKLYSASAKIAPTLDPKDVVEIYTYGSPDWSNWWWTISISARSGNYIRAIIPREDYLGTNLQPVAIKYWDLSYVEAFQIAERNGGKDWREKQTELIQTTATLAHSDPSNYLHWVVEYQTISGSEKKSVKINAYTGEVVTSESE